MAISTSIRGLFLLLALTTCALAVRDRLFTAARKSPDLRRRDQSLAPKYDSNTIYFDDGIAAGVQVDLNPMLPMLVLEDIDHHIASIDCSDSTIVIHFHDLDSFDAAHSAWSNETDFAVTTNHHDCQAAGEHGVRRVHMTDNDSQILTINLSGYSANLRDISPLMTIEIGEHVKRHIDSSSLRARQVAPTITNITSTSLLPTTISAWPSPTASATGSSLLSNICSNHLNMTILPPDSLIMDLIPYSIIPPDMTLSCHNCTVSGNIELIAGGFTINSSNSIEELRSFAEDGYLNFRVYDLAATMDFELAFLPGFSLLDFTAQLPSIPLGAIVIGNILKFGLVLDLVFPNTVVLNSPITLRTGFTLSAPPMASIYLNISDPDSSYTTGFSQTTLEALPLTADAKGLSMALTNGFRPQLVLGAGISEQEMNISADGGIGVYLDLPQVTHTFDIVDGVDDKCEPTTSGAQNGLVRVDSNVTFDGGAQWDINVNIPYTHGYYAGAEVPWLSYTKALPGQCLMWDEKSGSLMDAVAVMESENPGGKGSNDGSKKNVANILSPTMLSKSVACIVVILWGLR